MVPGTSTLSPTASGVVSHALGAADIDTLEPPGSAMPAASPGEVVLDGRRYTVEPDPATGDTLLRHRSSSARPDGGTASLEILLRLRRDGTVQRTIGQKVEGPGAQAQSVVTTTELDTAGKPTSEQRAVSIDDGTGSLVEETTQTSFSGGVPVQRVIDQVRTTTQDAADGSTATSTQTLKLTTGDGTAPIGDSDPAEVEYSDRLVQVTPGEGYSRGSDRTITQTRSAKGNTTTGLLFDENLELRVRFDVREGSYIERVIHVPLDRTTGQQLAGSEAEVVDTVDTRPIWEKGLEKARIWGNFTGSWASIIGLNLPNPVWARRLGAVGLGMSAAALAGNGYAWLADYRNGSPFDTARSFYDSLVSGSLYAVIRMRNPVAAARVGANLLGATSVLDSGDRLHDALAARNPFARPGVLPIPAVTPMPTPTLTPVRTDLE